MKRKRKVRLRLAPRARSDPPDLTKAIEHAIKSAEGCVEYKERTIEREGGKVRESERQIRFVPNEVLETEANRKAGALLDAKAAEERPALPPPPEAAEARGALMDKIKGLAAKGWNVTVGAALDWAWGKFTKSGS